jgi:hypothetical protein
LLDAKLSALAERHSSRAPGRTGAPERVPAAFPGGAALLEGERAWVLLEGNPVAAFGAALVWAARHGDLTPRILVDDPEAAGVLARRARLLDPAPTVLAVHGSELRPAEPAPLPPPAPADPATAQQAELLVDAGLEVVVEDGVVRGEVNGLEVARIQVGRSSAGVPLAEPLLEVGVGQADRELTAMLHGELTPTAQLDRVIEIVRRHRRPGAERHPLNQLVPERWLRARLVAHPERVGLARLRPAPTAVPRANLRERGLAAALGEMPDGAPAVVVCCVGVDLDLVPHAADTREALDRSAELFLVVPERDDHPATRALAARLVRPARVVPIPGDWRA